VKTTVEIDDAVLRAAEDQARKQGKPLGVLIEEALRITVKSTVQFAPTPAESSAGEGLEDHDPFFKALEEIRASGCTTGQGNFISLGREKDSPMHGSARDRLNRDIKNESRQPRT
jgi:hypothetical protein